MSSDSPCSRCAAHLGRSCCQAEEGEPLATLTQADAIRLETGTRWAVARMMETERMSPEDRAEYERLRPLYAGYFAQTELRLTLKRKDGACIFFEESRGCTLSPSVRPSACLLYPFDLDAEGNLKLQVDVFPSLEEARAAFEGGEGACFAVQESTGWPELLAAFGMTEEGVRELAARIRREVKAHRMGTL